MNCELMLTYDTPAPRQKGSRNVTGPKRLPTNIRFLPSIVAEKNVTKNILGRTEGQTDGRTEGRTEVKQYTPSSGAGIY